MVANSLFAGGGDVAVADDSLVRPGFERVLPRHAGHDERVPGAECTDDPELRQRRYRRRLGSDGHNDVKAGVERARPSLDQGVARERGLARFVAT
jgi:hypothetical protein